MSERSEDVIIIGSGPAGASVADVCVKSGLRTMMIDGGVLNNNSIEIPNKNFEWIRTYWDRQHIAFLGEKLDGVVLQGTDSHSGSMTSGARKHVSEKTEFLPIDSTNLEISQTLAKGGLSEAWGAASTIFDEEELDSVGIKDNNMRRYYQESIDLAGFSGKFEGYDLMPQAEIDLNARIILKKYEKLERRRRLAFKIEPPLLALLTRKKGNRLPTEYKDMDYWVNTGNSIYRSRLTIEDLSKGKNFKYVPDNVVLDFREDKNGIVLRSRNFSGKEREFRARILVIAAGAINTTKIVLKSLGLYNYPVKMLVKEHAIIPMINISMIGKRDLRKHSLCQLAIQSKFRRNHQFASFSQIYSYKSLLLFKLIPHLPLSAPKSMQFGSIYAPSLVLADVRFPSFSYDAATVELSKNPGIDNLIIRKNLDRGENKFEIKRIEKFMRSLGLITLGTKWMPSGSSAHYAGGIPQSEDTNAKLRSLPNGQLYGNSRIFIADSSTWKVLPAKPPTLTIMANARRVAYNAIIQLKKEL